MTSPPEDYEVRLCEIRVRRLPATCCKKTKNPGNLRRRAFFDVLFCSAVARPALALWFDEHGRSTSTPPSPLAPG
jgi:hypothetical protein